MICVIPRFRFPLVFRVFGLGAALLAASVPAASQSAISCPQARTAAERAICASPKLTALDARVANAYARALKLYEGDAETIAALRQDQRLYAAQFDPILEGPGTIGLEAHLKSRAELLDSLRPMRSGLLGVWRNALGEVRVTRGAKGALDVGVVTVEPTQGSWICDVKASVARNQGPLTLSGEAYAGWTITIARAGGALAVTEAAPKEGAAAPYCGMNGRVAGRFFPAR